MMWAPPPTRVEAFRAATIITEDIAESFDSRFAVSPCHRKGHSARVCMARVEGPLTMRIRIVVTRVGDDFAVDIRQRP
jgi:hypothetical protein